MRSAGRIAAARTPVRAIGPATIAMLAVFAATTGARGASGGWAITATPSSVVAGVPTPIVMTATNTAGGSSVGCVQLQVPAVFTVNAVGVDAVVPAHSWTADAPTPGPSGSVIVQVHAVTETDILKNDGDSVAFHVGVTGFAAGFYSWPAKSLDHASCTSGIDSTSITVSIIGSVSTPTPKQTPTPVPTPTPTPRPTATPAPTPRSTPTPTPTATSSASAPPGSRAPASPPPSPIETAALGTSPTPFGTATLPLPAPPSPSTGAVVPVAGSGSGSGGSGVGAGAAIADPYVVGAASGAEDEQLGLANAALGKLDGIVWAVPSLALAVPGILLLLAILAQVAAGAAWVPIVRRKLGSSRVRPVDPR